MKLPLTESDMMIRRRRKVLRVASFCVIAEIASGAQTVTVLHNCPGADGGNGIGVGD